MSKLQVDRHADIYMCVGCTYDTRWVMWDDVMWYAVTQLQPIADWVAQHLEIISKHFRFSTRRTRTLMGLIIYCLVLIVNPMGRILVRWKSLRNTLEIVCHPICNWLYLMISSVTRLDPATHCKTLQHTATYIMRCQSCLSCRSSKWIGIRIYVWDAHMIQGGEDR